MTEDKKCVICGKSVEDELDEMCKKCYEDGKGIIEDDNNQQLQEAKKKTQNASTPHPDKCECKDCIEETQQDAELAEKEARDNCVTTTFEEDAEK